jgi:diguanylate cyclase (GGDEF)-like protein
MLSLIYEDLDFDTIEERFVSLVAELFPFDRVGLFFVKHKKGLLKGKLGKGFEEGAISSIEVPIAEKYLLSRPLITGFPLWNIEIGDDPFLRKMGLRKFALIPVISRKRIPCWQVTNCGVLDCPAYGNKWLRCWLVPETKCKNGSQRSPSEKMHLCKSCQVFSKQDSNAFEGVMLVDGPNPIDDETVTMLSILAHAVGTAINNSKKYIHALRDAIHDDLTGLHNRRYFNERLIDEIERARRHGRNISLLFGDIDHFKGVNDAYGHPVGDRVLKMIGSIFLEKLRHSDLVARYGGEEFALLLFDSTREQAIAIAENLRQAIAEASLPGQEKISVTISFGVASLGEDCNTLEGLIARADKALYKAKTWGRNRVCAAG